jgi:hypothetical protein
MTYVLTPQVQATVWRLPHKQRNEASRIKSQAVDRLIRQMSTCVHCDDYYYSQDVFSCELRSLDKSRRSTAQLHVIRVSSHTLYAKLIVVLCVQGLKTTYH